MLDLPLCTLRQYGELIKQRLVDTAKMQMRVASWQTKTLASFMVKTAQIDERGFKALWKDVESIQLGDDEEGAATDTRSIEQIIEQGAIVPASRVKPGSFEQFMGQTKV